MQRYFLNGTIDNYSFLEEDIFHIQKVMRMHKGDNIEVVINQKAYLALIDNISPLKITIVSSINYDSEADNDVTLFYCLVKGDKLDLVIQKAVELGVKEIVLVQSKYCVVKFKKEEINKKLLRYQSIIQSACRQSHRLVIPKLDKIINIEDIDYSLLSDHNFIAYEKEMGDTKKSKQLFENIKEKESVSLLVGPEGGFASEEVDLMNRIGFVNISLGKRVLRSETAAISIISDLMFILESR